MRRRSAPPSSPRLVASDVHTADGATLRARRAVIAATDAPQLFEQLLADADLPDRFRSDLRRFE